MGNNDVESRARRYLDNLPMAPGMYAEDTPEGIVRDCLREVDINQAGWDRIEFAESELEDARLSVDIHRGEIQSYQKLFNRLAKLSGFKEPRFDPTDGDQVCLFFEHMERVLKRGKAHA